MKKCVEVVLVGNSGPMGKSMGEELGRWGLRHPWEGLLETVVLRGGTVQGLSSKWGHL